MSKDEKKSPYARHVFVCTGKDREDGCAGRGGEEIATTFAQEIDRAGLKKAVAVTRCDCLGICQRGPSAVIFPEGHWYTGLRLGEVKHIVDEHLLRGRVVARPADPDGKTIRSEISLGRARKKKLEQTSRKSGALPRELEALLRGFQKSRAALTGIELHIFDAVGSEATAQEVASRTKTDPRSVEMLLNSLVALGLLNKTAEIYSNTDTANNYLVSGAPFDSRAALMHTAHLWHHWSGLTESVRRGTAANLTEISEKDDAWTEAFIAAMHKYGSLRAPAVIAKLALEGDLNILDLGGGSGAYSIAFARGCPGAKVTLLDLRSVTPLTRRYVEEQHLSDRIRIVDGDLFQQTYGDAEYDLVFASAICHMLSPEQNAELFKRIFAALNPGGQIAIQDFVLAESRTEPEHGVMFALNMLVSTKGGGTYSAAEYTGWLSNVGFVEAKLLPLSGPTDLVTARRPEER